MICPNCKNRNFYNLANDYIKCTKCSKKLSLKKIAKDKLIIEKFCENKNALQSSKELKLNYKTIKDRFDLFRKKIAIFLENSYQDSIHDYSEYEEFYYFKQRGKSKKVKSLDEATNIIGFYSNQKVYTLLMPNIKYRTFATNDEDFFQYLLWYKLQSKNSHKTTLKLFWVFLEEELKKYKGVNEENFFYYLKECEFRFNYKKSEQIEILNSIYFQE